MQDLPSFSANRGLRVRYVPVPDQPPWYDLYVVVRAPEAGENVQNAERQCILKAIDPERIRNVHVWTPTGTQSDSNRQVQWHEATGLLQNAGVGWLADRVYGPGMNVLLSYCECEGKVTLPFVPEFAHDPKRAKQLADGHFYDILPISAEFVPTLNCVFRCQQCSYKIHKIASGLWTANNFDRRWHMAVDIVEPLVNRLAEGGIRYLVVTGGGEPLLNAKATLAALNAAKDSNIRTGLYTNGALLKPHIEAVLDAEPRFVRISVNAGTPEVHQAYHRPLKGDHDYLNDIRTGVRELALERANRNSTTEIGLSYLVSPLTYSDSGAFAQWAAQVAEENAAYGRPGIDFVRFTPAIEYFGYVQHSPEFLKNAVAEIRRGAKPILEQKGVQTTIFSRFWEVSEPRGYQECRGCSWFVEVSPDGSVYHCCEMDFLPGYRIGDLLPDMLTTIWASKRRHEVIAHVNDSGLRGCPRFCKPHTISTVAQKICGLCKNTPWKERVLEWLCDLHKMHCFDGDDFFQKQKTVAF